MGKRSDRLTWCRRRVPLPTPGRPIRCAAGTQVVLERGEASDHFAVQSKGRQLVRDTLLCIRIIVRIVSRSDCNVERLGSSSPFKYDVISSLDITQL